MLSREFQALLTNVGALTLGCYKAKLDNVNAGAIKEANIAVTSEHVTYSAGFPSFAIESELVKAAVTAAVSFEEISTTVFELISNIIDSLNAFTVPSVVLDLEVYRPFAANLNCRLTAYLLQSFSLAFSDDDFASVKFDFESYILNPASEMPSDLLVVSELPVETLATGQLQSAANLSIGKPKILIQPVSKTGQVLGPLSSVGAMSSATLTLDSVYNRIEAGFPKTLAQLVPVSVTTTLDIASEEFSTTELSFVFKSDSYARVLYQLALVGGNALQISLPICKVLPVSGVSLPVSDFATASRRFMLLNSAPVATLVTL